MKFDLHYDASSLEKARSGAIWGSIWVDMHGRPFPEAHWNDLPVAFLAELSSAVAQAGNSDGHARRVRFFDGPFWIDLTGQKGDEIKLSVNSGRDIPDVVISAAELTRILTRVGRALSEACQARGWGDHADVQRLRVIDDRRGS